MRLFQYYPQLLQIKDALKSRQCRVFLVGGALRDYYLSRRGHDFDFAVNKNAIDLARYVARRLKGAFVLLDGEHQSARVVVTMLSETWTFDFTDWRASTIEGDLKHRDFTINALAVDLFAKREPQTVQEVKGARADLKSGILRMAAKDVFKEDPLRLLRAFSLQASLDFNIERQTLAQIKKEAPLIRHAAMERIRDELFKILASPRAHAAFLLMDKIGLLAYVLPQTTVMTGVRQGGYHHLDVWRHSLEVLARLEKLMLKLSRHELIRLYLEQIIGGAHTRGALLKMAALLHDIGKPETRLQEAGRTTFHGHEHAGAHIVRLVAKHVKVSLKERFFLEDMVRLHLRPGYLSNVKHPTGKALFRYYRDTKQEAVSVAILSLADAAATRGPLTTPVMRRHHDLVCHMLIDRYFKTEERPKAPRLLTGHDLIKILKLKPSPLFGKILLAVEEAAALGKIKTKEQALSLARKFLIRS